VKAQDLQRPHPTKHWIAGRLVLAYLLFGLLWILFSDHLLSSITDDAEHFQVYSTYKGWAFIFITAGLLYLMIRASLRQQAAIEHNLILSEERWKFALEGADEGVWDWDLETDQVFRSNRWHQIYGYEEGDIGSTAQDGRTLMHPDDRERAIYEVNLHLSGGTSVFVSEFRLRCKDGSWKWTLSRGMVVARAPDGKPLRMIGTHADITSRKESEQEIFRLAHYDPVTGLPNRILFQDRFTQSIKQAKRFGTLVCLMYIDLDRFKDVNDSLGHHVGDLLLKEAGSRLLSTLRTTDTVARLGGDEFTILLNNVDNTGSIERLAQSVLDEMARPFHLNDEVVYISTSIGISMFPLDGDEAEVLLKNADQAMYAAKNQGRNRYYYFTSTMQEAALTRLRLANDLRIALAERQFIVQYQPIISLASGTIHKAEALVRWQHPLRGLVSPAEFIPIAEDTGLIVELGDFVFTQAVEMVARWRKTHPDFQVSINKSPVQFRQHRGNHTDWIAHLGSMGLDGDAIVIEITEGLLFDANTSETQQLSTLRDAGLQIAIDDFGTGYSSLAYIRKFDVDYVKIDQSFTRNLKQHSDELALCEAIIVMSHKLGIKVVAEGVETEEQRDLLIEAGCDYAQGYLFSRPISAEALEQLLEPESVG
jgi:diguanylate cyclase (GGDEF)-like protein/PAS domain S-box-containing protein